MCMNATFQLLNYLDGTPLGKTWNPYTGTAAEEFTRPLLPQEIGTFIDIPVTSGQIPSALNDGVLLRIGSNYLYPAPVSVHVFEGDAMLHSFKFNAEANTVSMSSAFLETPKLQIERQYGQGIYISAIEELFMGLNSDKAIADLSLFARAIKIVKFILCMLIGRSALSPFSSDIGIKDFNCANTATLQWNGKLFAACESSHFFEFRLNTSDMAVDSVGFTKLNDSWIDYPFVAHPRVDPFNADNLMVIGHDFEKGPRLAVGVFDRDYNLLNAEEVPLRHEQMVHEMSQTQHFMLIFDFNLWFGPDVLTEYGQMFHFVNGSTAPSRIGVIDKAQFANREYSDVAELVRWFPIDACLVMHVANAWEERDRIRIVAPRFAHFDINDMLHHEAVSKRERYATAQIYEWTLDLKTGAVEEGAVGGEKAQRNVEMPWVHPLFEGRKARFVWFSLIDYSDDALITSSYGVAKYDVQRREVVGTIEYGLHGDGDGADDAKFGSFEAVFVPKERFERAKVRAEDDGFLVNVIWNKKTKQSTLQVFDAHTMSSQPVAVVQLPYRIPAGFHSNFVFAP